MLADREPNIGAPNMINIVTAMTAKAFSSLSSKNISHFLFAIAFITRPTIPTIIPKVMTPNIPAMNDPVSIIINWCGYPKY